MKRVLRIISGSLVLLAMLAVLIYGAIRSFGLPLGFLTQPLSVILTTMVPEGSVDIKASRLQWSPENNFFALSIGRLRIREAADAGVLAEDVYIELSGPAFWEDGRIAVSKAIIERVTLMPTRVNDLPAAAGLLLPSGGGQTDFLQYISEIAVRDIRVQSGGEATSNGSHFLMMRKGSRISASVRIEYGAPERVSSVIGTAEISPAGDGQAELALSRLDPRDIGRFSNFLTPLRGIQLPVTAMMNVNFAKGGKPINGTAELFVDPGLVQLTGARVDVRELVMAAEIDFLTRRIFMRDARFNVAGVAGQLSGRASYEQNQKNRLSTINFAFDGTGARVDLPGLLKQTLTIPRAKLNGNYDFIRDAVEIDLLELTHNFGTAKASGLVSLTDRNPHFNITTDFGAMGRAGAEGLWPLTISPRARDWVEKNLFGGQLRAGSFAINASLEELTRRKKGDPMREDALLLDLEFENIGVRYLAGLPVLDDTSARLILRGSSMEVRGEGGIIQLPTLTGDVSPMKVETVRFFTPNSRDALQAVDIDFSGTGVTRDILRAINRPPLNALRQIDFDFDRLDGTVQANVALQVPVFAPPAQRKLRFKVDVETRDLAVDGALGPFTLSDGRSKMTLTHEGLRAVGRVKANGVDGGFEWHQPFGAAQADAALAVHGFFSPQDIADLGQGWAATRLVGKPHVNLLINGPITRPTDYRVFVDLKSAKLTMQPLAFEKPEGTAGAVTAVIKNDESGEIEEIRARLDLPDQKPLRVKMGFSGPIMNTLEMTPLSLGRDKNLRAEIETVNDKRLVKMTADTLDVSRLFYGGNRAVKLQPEKFAILPFLGDEAVIEFQADKLVGANNVTMDQARMRVVRQNGLHEKLAMQGVFYDGTELLMDIERDTVFRRKFFVQADRAANLFRMLDWIDEIYGGSLVVQGRLYDEGEIVDGRRRDMSGRVTMTGFRARNVPVLASIVSLASLRGISDTLSGDGIKFEKAQGNFAFGGGRLTVKKGRMHGAAVGITLQGDYDIDKGDVDFGGTVIPSYTLNSFFGKIPIVGPILSGRRGEGILGIGYRVSGEAGKANILVNPLSVLTPGFLRRIFEIGIGLGDSEQRASPDLDEPDLTE
jgi:hypothetical protein